MRGGEVVPDEGVFVEGDADVYDLCRLAWGGLWDGDCDLGGGLGRRVSYLLECTERGRTHHPTRELQLLLQLVPRGLEHRVAARRAVHVEERRWSSERECLGLDGYENARIQGEGELVVSISITRVREGRTREREATSPRS